MIAVFEQNDDLLNIIRSFKKSNVKGMQFRNCSFYKLVRMIKTLALLISQLCYTRQLLCTHSEDALQQKIRD